MQSSLDSHTDAGSSRRHAQPAQAGSSARPLLSLDNSSALTRSTLDPAHPRKRLKTAMAESHSAVGQFALAPATQQTTVVTTTTTTVNLAPFLLKPPQDLRDRDPKQYPLAFSPTPASMKRFGFNVGGAVAHYREADDPDAFIQQVGMIFIRRHILRLSL